MVGDGSYLMMAQEIVTAVAGGHQAHDRAGPEPRLRVDRRAVGVGRLAALRHQVPLPWNGRDRCRSTSPPTPPASARASLDATHDRGVRGRAARGGAPPTSRPSCRSRPTRSCPRPTPRRGGTCRWPRSPRSTPRAPRARPTSATSATQKPYLKTPRDREDTVSTVQLETIQHRIGGARDRRRLDPHRARSTTRRPAQRAGQVLLAERGRRRRRGAGRARRRSRPGATSRVVRRARVMFAFRELVEQHTDELARIISSEHGKIVRRRQGRGHPRAWRSSSSRAGSPQLLKGEYSDQVSTDVDRSRSASRSASAPGSRRSTSRSWSRCGCTRWRSRPATRSCSSRPSATRRCRTSSPSSTPRPGCPTASSTSSTATRSRSTRCSTTRTSPRSRFVGSTPIAQYIHERGDARTASACRRSAARRTTRS